MSFPLTDGSVDDGVLTCPWHHARFELSCSDTFDPFADDVRTFPVEVRDGDVHVDPEPETAPAERWEDRLDHGRREALDLVIGKAVIGLADADRAEERSSWRQPIGVAGLVADAAADLPALLEAGAGGSWTEPADFVARLLGDDPHAILDALTDAVASGATASQLARAVAHAAARRVAQFGTANEFRDWNTVHHTYTYANAVCGLAGRTDAPEPHRAVFDGAVSVYLDRFLNTPPIPLPDPDGDRESDAVLDDLLETFEVEADETVGRAGRHAAEYLASGGEPARLKRALGEVLLREDAGFHPRQNVEAAFARYDAADDGHVHLVAAARYLAAHTPTRREGEQTFRIAERLHRGEAIHEA